MTRSASRATLLATAALLFAGGARAQFHHHHRHGDTASAPSSAAPPGKKGSVDADAVPADRIVATVNGDAITEADVDDRAKLFALSTGMHVDAALLDRLKPQITRQLVDEKLKLQELQQRKIVVTPEEISDAIGTIESRNGMTKNALQNRLAADGVSLQTLIDQIRVQIGWSHVLRQNLGPRALVKDSEVEQRANALRQEQGQPEYDIAEIFIPIDDPAHADEADHFAEAVIQQLRAGAPFGIVAAQFGQNQNALEGGDLGWVTAERLDPEVVAVASQMPVGAISNPIRVAGGYDIITLHGKRTVGNQLATVLNIRQAFFPFTEKLDPAHPTAGQIADLQKARALAQGTHSCDEIEAANKAAGNARPSDPGPLIVSELNPQMAALLQNMQPGQTTKPLVSSDGIAVIGVCAREEKNLASQTPAQIRDQLLAERVELASRQEIRELHRRAVIDLRSS